jgi:hypothetical protein
MHILELPISNWNLEITPQMQMDAHHALEAGQVLFLPNLDFTFQPQEEKFLTPDCSKKGNKNISYNSKNNELKGTSCVQKDYIDLKQLLSRYARTTTQFLQRLLPHYASHLENGRTSYRPIQIKGRSSSLRKDDTRLHIDAFPATPNQGKRILRFFTNVNPYNEARIWRLGEPFPDVAQRFTLQSKPYRMWLAKLLQFGFATKTLRTAYDHYMLQIHDRMKFDEDYQRNVDQIKIPFPPQSSWIVFTDQVSHAAMSGQYAFEQTFYLPSYAMLNQTSSPLAFLSQQLQTHLV